MWQFITGVVASVVYVFAVVSFACHIVDKYREDVQSPIWLHLDLIHALLCFCAVVTIIMGWIGYYGGQWL